MVFRDDRRRSLWLLLAVLGVALAAAVPLAGAQEGAPEAPEAPPANNAATEEFEVPKEVRDRERAREMRREERRREMMDREGLLDPRDRDHDRRRMWEDPRRRDMPWSLEDDAEKEKAFKEADIDGDSKLSEEEFKALVVKPIKENYDRELERVRYGGRPNRRRDMMRERDIRRRMVPGEDEPGAEALDKEEEREFELMKKMHEERLAKMDEETRKQVLEKQARHEEKHKKRAERDMERQTRGIYKMYPRLDRDGDGAISLEEWMKI